MRGKAWKFGDSISTDLIAPGRYYHLRSNLPELAKHCLEDADPNFAANVKPGDFVVGGRNFGLGSSREHAPVIIKMAGAGAVLAESFARIFYRNAVNVGLPVIECDTSQFDAGDELDVDVAAGVIKDLTKGITVTFHPLEEAMRRILEAGGLVEHIKKHGGFAIS
jgi:3-isopropylmalate/(R)-2-methylmalate dehydratase small subunit